MSSMWRAAVIIPVLLAAGKSLFSDADIPAQRLRLLEHQVYANGIQKQVLEVLR